MFLETIFLSISMIGGHEVTTLGLLSDGELVFGVGQLKLGICHHQLKVLNFMFVISVIRMLTRMEFKATRASAICWFYTPSAT